MRNLIKILPFAILALCANQASFGQILLQESFDGGNFPSSWNRSSNGASWDRVGSSSGNGNLSHSGAGKAQFDNGGGLITGLLSILLPVNTGVMVSPAVNFSTYTGGSNVVNVWVYRTSKKPGNADRIEFYLNNSTNLTGATLLETIHRNRNMWPAEEGTGWYRYSFDVPVAFNTASAAYLIVKGIYANGEEIQLDDITVAHCGASVSGVVSNVTCMGKEDGAINVTVNNAIAPYNFEWTAEGNAFAWDEDVTSLLTGYYDVLVTDAVGCKAYGSYGITQPASLNFTANVSPVPCNATTGTIIATPSGGTLPYTYSWSGPNAFNSTSKDIAAPPGLYSMTLTDHNGCISMGAYTIGEAIGVSGNLIHNICYNGSIGNIELVLNGGTPPYNFNWSNNAPASASVNGNLAAGSYSVLVSDPNGCKGSGTFIINHPYEIAAIDTIKNVSCFGGNNGTINLGISGGTPPYTYIWSNTQTSKNLSNLAVGTYQLTVVDAALCTKSFSYTINQPDLLVATNSATDISCNGGNTGAIDVAVNGGTAPYTYVWAGSAASTEDRNNLQAGTYSVTVTDAKGCIVSTSAALSQPAVIAIAATKVNVSCYGGNNGSIDLAVTGGVAPYTFNWDNNAVTEDISGLTAGNYSVIVTDANNCTKSVTVILTQPTAIAPSSTTSNTSCFGGNNGKINLSVNGGNTPYSYSWSNSATTMDLQNIAAGTYTVIVTDANGCSVSHSASVGEPAALIVSGTQSNVLCNGGNIGAIDLTVTGGDAPYHYNWGASAPSSQDRSGLTAGNYNVQVTDHKGCITSGAFTINEPTIIVVTPSATNILCNGSNTGSVSVSANGGTGAYTYSWNTGATTATVSNLVAGTYTVTVTDANNCSKTASVTVSQPTAIATSASQMNISCKNGSNGSIDLSVSAGTNPYTYSWSNAATTQDIASLVAGTYTVTVTDANNCNKTASITIAEPAVLAVSGSINNAACKNGTNGSINVTVAGGTASYTYVWSNNAVAEDIAGLSAGTYTIAVTDAKGCMTNSSFVVNEPTAVSVSANVVNVSCKNGSNGAISLTSTGGTGAYTYKWENNTTAANRTGLVAGTYTVTVKDANGCSISSVYTISEPTLLAVSGTSTNVSCNGGANGSVNISVSGGSAPYSYNWSNSSTTQDISNASAGTYSVTVTDAKGCVKSSTNYAITQPAVLNVTGTATSITCSGGNNGAITLNIAGGTSPFSCNWSNNCVTPNQAALAAGVYNVTVTDGKGCTDNASFTITQTPGMTVSGAIVHPACNSNNGKITLTVAGGVGTKTYLWNNGSTAQNRTNLAPGTYSVTVKDANNCTATASFVLSIPTISVNSTVTNVTCNGADNGSISLSGSGGTSPYTYDWYNSTSTSASRTNMDPGTYIVNMKDSKNCSVNDTFLITEPAILAVSATEIDVTCYNANNGSISLAVTGGTSPYTYSWSNSGGTSANRNNLDAGIYTVTVKDAKNCTKTASYSIVEPTEIVITTTKTNTSCNTCSTGSINATITGGTTPYTYKWSNNATTQDLTGKAAGTYTLTVTDAKGCTKTKTETVGVTTVSTLGGTITVTPMFTVNPGGAAFTIYEGYGPQSVTLTAAGSGGVPPYTYTWSGTSTTSASRSVSPTSTTTYVVTIKDATNATVTRTQQIKVVDVSACGNKVKVCHNGNNTLEISVNAVPAHLAHGDYLGECENNCNSRIVEMNDEHSHEAAIKVFPNPSTGVFTIEVPYEGGHIEMLITDLHGKLIERKSILKNWEPQHRFDFSNLAKGVYMIQLKTEEQMLKEKIVIQ